MSKGGVTEPRIKPEAYLKPIFDYTFRSVLENVLVFEDAFMNIGNVFFPLKNLYLVSNNLTQDLWDRVVIFHLSFAIMLVKLHARTCTCGVSRPTSGHVTDTIYKECKEPPLEYCEPN